MSTYMDENYEKLSLLGRGFHGMVWLGRRRSDDKQVALKEIKIDHLNGKDYDVVLQEIKILAQLKHPNIISYLGSYETESSVSIIMELATTGSLHQYLTERQDQLLEEEEVMQFFTQLVLGLHYLHSCNILHRDLKTHNVLLLYREESNLTRNEILVKISDFGLSKMLTSHTDASVMLGTPSYSSPETCNGLPYTQSSDIWALGCILYEMLTLQKAFEAPTLAAIVLKVINGEVKPITNRSCTASVTHLVNALLQQSPRKRPTTSALLAHPFVAPYVFRTHASIGFSPSHSSTQTFQ